MYFNVNWEVVNSIIMYDTWILIPNLSTIGFFTIYTDVL